MASPYQVEPPAEESLSPKRNTMPRLAATKPKTARTPTLSWGRIHAASAVSKQRLGVEEQRGAPRGGVIHPVIIGDEHDVVQAGVDSRNRGFPSPRPGAEAEPAFFA